MKQATITIDGRTHLLVFSLRVIRACGDRYGSVEHIDSALSSGDTMHDLDEAVWLLATMMEAGAKYAAANGIENPEPLTVDEFYDLCDINDLAALRGKIVETVTASSAAEVEAAPPKGGKGKNAASREA